MSLGKMGGLKLPIHGVHPAAFHMPKAGGAPMHTGSTTPRTHISTPHMPHPASLQTRLPRGEVNTSDADPAPYAPGIGRF